MDFTAIYNYIMSVLAALIDIPLSILKVLFYTVIELAKTICMVDTVYEETEEAEAEPNNDNNKHIGFRQ